MEHKDVAKQFVEQCVEYIKGGVTIGACIGRFAICILLLPFFVSVGYLYGALLFAIKYSFIITGAIAAGYIALTVLAPMIGIDLTPWLIVTFPQIHW